jgi:hypothetical protein
MQESENKEPLYHSIVSMRVSVFIGLHWLIVAISAIGTLLVVNTIDLGSDVFLRKQIKTLTLENDELKRALKLVQEQIQPKPTHEQ